MWPPSTILNSVTGKIRIPNLTSEPQTLRRNEHFCQALPTLSPQRESEQQYAKPLIGASKHKHNENFSSDIQLDPDNILDLYTRQKFAKLHHEYDIVFDPNIQDTMVLWGHVMLSLTWDQFNLLDVKAKNPVWHLD